MIPAFKLVDARLETRQHIVNAALKINKERSKNRKIRKEKKLERLISSKKTLCDLLYLTFEITLKGQVERVTCPLYVFKQIPGTNSYMIGGNKVIAANQIVDNSTFVSMNNQTGITTLKFKTNQNFSVDIYIDEKNVVKDVFGKKYKLERFVIDLFKKETNPLSYFFGRYGIEDSLVFLGLNECMSIVRTINDTDHFVYFQLPVEAENIYLEVNSYMLEKDNFVRRMVAGIIWTFGKVNTDIPGNLLFMRDFWMKELGLLFAGKRQIQRGSAGLVSFKRVLDPATKRRLAVPLRDKKDPYCIVRWLMKNFDVLISKDSHDLKYKRIRCNESIGYFFDANIAKSVYSLLNTPSPKMEKYISTLSSINPTILLKSGTVKSKGGDTHNIFEYERHSDIGNVISLCKYTLKGPNGISGKKHEIKLEYKDIYPSHIGRYDLNTCSNSVGLAGVIAANCKIYENGYFEDNYREPVDDSYERHLEIAYKRGYIPKNYTYEAQMFFKTERLKGEDGKIHLNRKRSPSERIMEEIENHPERFIFISNKAILPSRNLIAAFDKRGKTEDGKIVGIRRKGMEIRESFEGFEFDEKGRIKLGFKDPIKKKQLDELDKKLAKKK